MLAVHTVYCILKRFRENMKKINAGKTVSSQVKSVQPSWKKELQRDKFA